MSSSSTETSRILRNRCQQKRAQRSKQSRQTPQTVQPSTLTVSIVIDVDSLEKQRRRCKNITASPYTLASLPYNNDTLPLARFPTLSSVPDHLMEEFLHMFPVPEKLPISCSLSTPSTGQRSAYFGKDKRTTSIYLESDVDDDVCQRRDTVTDGGKSKIPLIPCLEISGKAITFLPLLVATHWRNTKNLDAFASLILHKTAITLSDVDWLCINYSKIFQVRYKLEEEDPVDFVLHESYSQSLQVYQRSFFDVFARNHRILIEWVTTDVQLFEEFVACKPMTTTLDILWDNKRNVGMRWIGGKRMVYLITSVAQLNFFRWANENKVVDYCLEHVGEIRRHQDQVESVPLPAGVGKRRKLNHKAQQYGFRVCDVPTIITCQNSVHQMTLDHSVHRNAR